METISNPSLNVVDLAPVHLLSKKHGIPFVVDATFSPPCAIKTFEYGAETVIHSLSKYCAGHNDVIAGAVITKNIELHEKLKGLQRSVGAILSPDECYRVIQGLKTLTLRWNKVSESAQILAEYLLSRSEIKKVRYPGLTIHEGYNISSTQFKNGYGAVVSFELKTHDIDKIKKFVEVLTSNGIIIYGESLASPESILAYPAFMSHRALSEADRTSLGISKGFFRFSVGFEDISDILQSFEKALTSIDL